tara:strand:- start:986 stop:1645 length:660 start_codon:yes stop_codon:yes gene_type:complete
MKLFLDSAITDEIRQYYNTGMIDGVTTNPTLIYKSGKDPEDVYQELIDMGIPDISMEVVGDENTMIGEGRRLIKKFGNRQATIKVPCTVEGLAACRALSDEGARVNVTLIFSLAQSILAHKSGATYVSPFVGRVDDNSFNGLELIKEITATFCTQDVDSTHVLAASLRDVHSVAECFTYGADIVTMPPKIFDKMYNHVLTEKGLELFDADYAATIGKTL